MILVAGGTGTLGRRVVARLVARGERVRVLTRDPARAAGLEGAEVCVGDVRTPATLTAAAEGARVVVSAIHGFAGPGGVTPASIDRDGNAHLIAAAAQAGADVVLMSIVGVAADAAMDLFRMKFAAEQQVRAGAAPWTIVRATAFRETWLRILRETAGKGGRPLVFGRGDNPINFVAVDDVAVAVERACLDRATRGTVIEVGGEDLTFNQLAATVGRPRHLPRAMLHVMATTMRLFRPSLARQCRAALVMDTADFRWRPDQLESSAAGTPAS